jgi:hypothetical protein
LLTNRDTILAKAPPWLTRGLGGKLLYTIGLHLDGFTDAAVAGVKLRFPGLYSNESLPYLGRDRRIRRGVDEANENYAARLTRWLDDHRKRGGPYALLAQLFAYYAPNNVAISVVYRSGRRYSMDVNGTITRDDVSWDIDGEPEKWARWWLVFDAAVAPPPPRTWGGGLKWGQWVWGSGLTWTEIQTYRVIPREWGNGHSFGYIKVRGPGNRLWGFGSKWGTGTWGTSSSTSFNVE